MEETTALRKEEDAEVDDSAGRFAAATIWPGSRGAAVGGAAAPAEEQRTGVRPVAGAGGVGGAAGGWRRIGRGEDKVNAKIWTVLLQSNDSTWCLKLCQIKAASD